MTTSSETPMQILANAPRSQHELRATISVYIRYSFPRLNGHFVRNSNTLIPDLIQHGALYRLVEIVTKKNATSLSAIRIALFSIGNLCAYPDCRKVFEELNVRDLVKKFSVRIILILY